MNFYQSSNDDLFERIVRIERVVKTVVIVIQKCHTSGSRSRINNLVKRLVVMLVGQIVTIALTCESKDI